LDDSSGPSSQPQKDTRWRAGPVIWQCEEALKASAKLIGGSLLANRDLNRLAAHSALQQLAWGIFTAFSAVFLLRQGLSAAEIFLCFGAIIVLRSVIRPILLLGVRKIGARSTLIIGTLLYGMQSPLLAPVHGLDLALLAYSVAAALAQAVYWTPYHAMFAALGDASNRGSQVGWRQLFVAIAGTMGPAVGGITLTIAGPWAAFGAAAIIECAAVVPLTGVTELPIARTVPSRTFQFSKRGMLLLGSDGWIFNSSAWAWSLILFQALDARYDAFGGALAVLALAGAVSGLALGRLIDMGHARRAIWVNAATLAVALIAKAACGSGTVPVLAVAFGATLLGGLYVPALMTAIYNEAKASPCPFRFHFAAELGWDIGGALACVVAAVLCASGAPLQAVILLALPMVALQAFVLDASYATRKSPIALLGTELPGR
jgi:DHA1 family inner membrane transport protein